MRFLYVRVLGVCCPIDFKPSAPDMEPRCMMQNYPDFERKPPRLESVWVGEDAWSRLLGASLNTS